MSRSTQFIGLTKLAEDFVKDLEEVDSDRSAEQSLTEEISFRRWKMPTEDCYGRKNGFYREVEQAAPWSSGPMIFTCLEADFGNGARDIILEWIHDPRLGKERSFY
jgi:hypothetical protein